MSLKLATLVSVIVAGVSCQAANAARFSLIAQPQGGQAVHFIITNTLETRFTLYRDGAAVDQITGDPSGGARYTETDQPLGQHTYQAKSRCTALGCADQSNLVTVTVT